MTFSASTRVLVANDSRIDAPGLDRRLHGPLDRVGEGRDAVADGGEVMLAMVRDHESGGHRGEHDEAQPQRGAAEQEGPGIRVVRAQCGL